MLPLDSKASQGSISAPSIVHHHRVHQSSVKSLCISHISENDFLLVTGGDDNALAISLLHLSGALQQVKDSDRANILECSAVILPKAHAAAINAVVDISGHGSSSPESTSRQRSSRQNSKQFAFATTGNDQLIKTWSVTVDVSRAGANGIEVQKAGKWKSEVADATCMAFVNSDSTDEALLVVAGIGVEMWTVRGMGLVRDARNERR